ncbi:MAG: FAD-dependent monooxygenase [Ardenticatenaceae bacterium]|nr:FAD-dependent monooxygenase [Ardenticatenaceae bacterium]
MNLIRKDHAIVLGGSMAGLLTARVLSKHFQRVTVIEKDAFEERRVVRKGVPHGHQLHIVLARGLQIMEAYFPGLTAELAAGGAVVSDDLALDMCWFANEGYRPQVATGLKSVMLTRPFLEKTIRKRAAEIPNIMIADGTRVAGLCGDSDGQRITGVRLAGRPEQELQADLVVDTTGRGSKSPAWLAEIGYPQPELEEVHVKIRYASRLYRRPRGFRTLIVTGGQPPFKARQGAVQPIEGERLIVTLHGRGSENPSQDPAEFEAHARALLTSDIADVMEGLEPLGDIVTYNIPRTRWLHYEKLSSFPAGYLVLGDAICALNPVYGQGMTSAALQVEVLDRLLEKRPLNETFWKPFFKQIARVVGVPWQLTVGEDFLYPQTEGIPPSMPGVVAAYFRRLMQVANGDSRVFQALFNVMHLVKQPTSLFHPNIVWRVLWGKQPSAKEV